MKKLGINKRVATTLAVGMLLAPLGAAQASGGPGGTEGCIVTPSAYSVDGTVPTAGNSCAYVVSRGGGFVASSGSQFSITLTRTDGTSVSLPGSSKQGCNQWTSDSTGAPYVNVSSVAVVVTAGAVAAGNPVPTSAANLTPGDSTKC